MRSLGITTGEQAPLSATRESPLTARALRERPSIEPRPDSRQSSPLLTGLTRKKATLNGFFWSLGSIFWMTPHLPRIVFPHIILNQGLQITCRRKPALGCVLISVGTVVSASVHLRASRLCQNSLVISVKTFTDTVNTINILWGLWARLC